MEVCTPAVASVDCDNPVGPFEMDKRVCVRVSDPGFSPRRGPKVLLHLWYFYPHNLSLTVSSSMPAGPSQLGYERHVYSCWLHHSLLCYGVRTHVCVCNYFYFTHFLHLWGLSTHSWGRPLSIENFGLLRLLKHSTVRRGSGTTCAALLSPPPPLSVGQHLQFLLFFLLCFFPPNPPTKESNRAMGHSAATVQAIVHNRQAISSEDACVQTRRAQHRKDFTCSSEVL